jgi:hypothetical protein
MHVVRPRDQRDWNRRLKSSIIKPRKSDPVATDRVLEVVGVPEPQTPGRRRGAYQD